jgi:LacI family transcriptional regulator
LIHLPPDLVPPALRVAILTYDPKEETKEYIYEVLHLLTEAGHQAFFASKSFKELGMSVAKVARHVNRHEADAWVLISASREVLEWFCERGIQAFAIFGGRRGLAIAGAGPDQPSALAAATRRLIELGHRRIIVLSRGYGEQLEAGPSESSILDELEANGITPGPYNLPNWEKSIAGFHGRLDQLMRVTPPTALIVSEPAYFIAVQQFLAVRGLRVPQDISLICTDADSHFKWCQPSIAHIRWDNHRVMRRLVHWANNVAIGKDDKRQVETRAEFVEGGTIGPVARSR